MQRKTRSSRGGTAQEELSLQSFTLNFIGVRYLFRGRLPGEKDTGGSERAGLREGAHRGEGVLCKRKPPKVG